MSREEFTTQVDTDVLSAVRKLAREEGRQLEALVDEALSDLVEKHRKDLTRLHVMDAYHASHEKFGSLYKKLAE